MTDEQAKDQAADFLLRLIGELEPRPTVRAVLLAEARRGVEILRAPVVVASESVAPPV